LGAAVTAHIVKNPQGSAVAHHQQRLIENADCQHVALGRHIRGQPDAHPGFLEHCAALDLKEAFVREVSPGQALVSFEQGRKVGGKVHLSLQVGKNTRHR
jgi:hypothetical protein